MKNLIAKLALSFALIMTFSLNSNLAHAADPYNEFLADSLFDGGLEIEGTKTIGEVTLSSSSVCENIEAHAPVGEGATFSTEVGKVWVYTKFSMDKSVNSSIKHVYFYKGKLVSSISLDVKGPSFRTNSYKTITDKMAGEWKVEIQSENGEVFETLNFTIE